MDLNTKTYVNIAERRSTGFNEIEKSLEVVRQFIIDKKRIIYGGMAIDLSLKLAGAPGIYSEDVIPDYDFMSPDFYEESNELAKKLHNLGMPNVSAINAFHFNSRRVRVNFKSVADISYIPKNIYESIPTITIESNKTTLKKYNGIRIVHPDFQRLDLHRAFTIPYSSPPLEVILHRLEKDQKRFRLLDEKYPILLDPKLISPGLKSGSNTSIRSGSYKIPVSLISGSVLSGVSAYALVAGMLKRLMNSELVKTIIKKSSGFKSSSDWIPADYEISANEIVITIPEFLSGTITIMTDDFESVAAEVTKSHTSKPGPEYYNKWLDNIRPRMMLFSGTPVIEVMDINGELTPCYDLQKSINVINKLAGIKTPDSGKDLGYIPGINSLLMYLLQKYFETGDKVWRSMYQSGLNIRTFAEELYELIEEAAPSGDSTESRETGLSKLYENLPFFLPVNTYGRNNWSTDYVISTKEKKYFILKPEIRPNFRPVFGYYPEKTPDWPDFEVSSFYALDGKKTGPFKPTTLAI